MNQTPNKWRVPVLLLSGCLLIFALIYGVQSYLGYQQVKTAADQCYDQGGYPKIVKSGWEVKLFECNFYDEN